MIADFNIHAFPFGLQDQRDEYLRRDPTFRELYSSPNARRLLRLAHGAT